MASLKESKGDMIIFSWAVKLFRYQQCGVRRERRKEELGLLKDAEARTRLIVMRDGRHMTKSNRNWEEERQSGV